MCVCVCIPFCVCVQLFRINEDNQLMQYDQCLTRGADNSAVIVTHCDRNQHTEWKYFKVRHAKTHNYKRLALRSSLFPFFHSHFDHRIFIVSLMWRRVIYAFLFPTFFMLWNRKILKGIVDNDFFLICAQENVWTDQTCSTKSLYLNVTPAKPLRNGRWITSWLSKEYLLNIKHIRTSSLQSCGADDVVVGPIAVPDTEGGSLTAASEACPYAPRD